MDRRGSLGSGLADPAAFSWKPSRCWPVNRGAMKITRTIVWLVLVCASLGAADPGEKEFVAAAANKLGEQPNYSWKSTTQIPEGAQFRPGPMEGRTEKGGFTYVTTTLRDNPLEMALKGGKTAVLSEGEWKLATEFDSTQGTGRLVARIVQRFRAPAGQAVELADAARSLKQDGDALVGEFTDEGAKAQLQARTGSAKEAAGSVRFWLKDGILTKYEFKLKGKIERN